MAMKSDFDDAVESSLNEEESDEDIVAEYVENEKIDEEYAERCLLGTTPIEEPISLVRQVSEYLLDSPCCTKNCCVSWKERDLAKHAEDMKHLSKSEKKLVLLTVLRNSTSNPYRKYTLFGAAPAFEIYFPLRTVWNHVFGGFSIVVRYSYQRIERPFSSSQNQQYVHYSTAAWQ